MIFTKIVITNCHEKLPKIAVNILQKNSDNERYLQNAQKQAILKYQGITLGGV